MTDNRKNAEQQIDRRDAPSSSGWGTLQLGPGNIRTLKSLEYTTEIAFDIHGGAELFFADVDGDGNGDGRPEAVIYDRRFLWSDPLGVR